MDNLYSFVYRGMLTEESLDKAGRVRREHFGEQQAKDLQKSLCYEFLDEDKLPDSQMMAVVYTAVHCFENMVRYLVMKSLSEGHGETWWDKISDRTKKKVKTRQEEDQKFRWHGARGTTPLNYCDFGDLQSIIINNWDVFEDILANVEWVKSVLGTLEKSRNIVMHGGVLAREDIERIGMNIRDWVRQTG